MKLNYILVLNKGMSVKIAYTNHALQRTLERIFGYYGASINDASIAKAKIILDKLIIVPQHASLLGDGIKIYLKIDSFEGFEAVGFIEKGVIVIKTVSPTTK